MLNNFEFFNLSINESNEILEPMMSNAVEFMGIYIEENIPNQDIRLQNIWLHHIFICVRHNSRKISRPYLYQTTTRP